jgi:hypothetical protein
MAKLLRSETSGAQTEDTDRIFGSRAADSHGETVEVAVKSMPQGEKAEGSRDDK